MLEAAQRVKDPEQGTNLMMQEDRDPGQQAHRELNRHVHNFVSSALTLIEHTRNFMRKNYADTNMLADYEKQVVQTFAQSPVAQFIQGLRNYMLHRGLPNSRMFMTFIADPSGENGMGTMETGVTYDTSSLLDWSDWRPQAITYLEQAGKSVDPQAFTEEYVTLVNQFQDWLDSALDAYHESDLKELGELQQRERDSSRANSDDEFGAQESQWCLNTGRFEYSGENSVEIERSADSLFEKIRELQFSKYREQFPSERPSVTVNRGEISGPVTRWGQDLQGNQVFEFIQSRGKSYGLMESDFEELDDLVEVSLKPVWANSSLSREFIENTFFGWARERFESGRSAFAEALKVAARESVVLAEIWVPIANMEVEKAFEFGPVRIEPITAAVLEAFFSTTWPSEPEQKQGVQRLFERLTQEIQGLAAVFLSVDAEPGYAQERGLQIAQDALGLLRFFSPGASTPFVFNPVALMGTENIPRSKLIVRGEGFFRLIEGLLPKNIGFWRCSNNEVSNIRSDDFSLAGSLVSPEGLSEFALSVRASLLIYSEGSTLGKPIDKLRNYISALESILLKHEMEPRVHNISNRISVLLVRDSSVEGNAARVVRAIYWLKDQPESLIQRRRHQELIAEFSAYTHCVLHSALRNTAKFRSKNQFVTEVDRLGWRPEK
ncbi:MAG: hypothetical protein CMN27_15305 [Salinisphaera sp.]|nr:hypothetical protein [Salinisphaera sp.]